jgi:hypothetical protein
MWERFIKGAAAKRIISKLLGILTCLLGLFFLDLSLIDTNTLSRLTEFFAAICFLFSGGIRLWLTRRRLRSPLDTPY